MAVIECVELSKAYGKRVTALNEITLSIDEGTSFGLLGENGAGKSTLVRILMGFIFPTSGRVQVLGEEKVARAHPRIGYVHERPIFEIKCTGHAYLTYMGQLSGLWNAANRIRINALLEQVGLYEAAERSIDTYSKGMLQRLAIAQALLADPALLILDEPTSGLDPRSQWEVRQIIDALRKQGKTILICSHYLTEVEALCDTVGILRHGHLILQGKVADLLRSQGLVEIVLAKELAANDVVERLHIKEQVTETQGNLLRITDDAQSIVLTALVQAQIGILSLNPVTRTLEEVYVRTTQTNEHVEKVLANTGSGGK
jgi:ABC-2 type transport system ATP-binding protein